MFVYALPLSVSKAPANRANDEQRSIYGEGERLARKHAGFPRAGRPPGAPAGAARGGTRQPHAGPTCAPHLSSPRERVLGTCVRPGVAEPDCEPVEG